MNEQLPELKEHEIISFGAAQVSRRYKVYAADRTSALELWKNGTAVLDSEVVDKFTPVRTFARQP